MRTNISISPHTFSSREATSQPAKKGKNKRGEEDVYITVTEWGLRLRWVRKGVKIISKRTECLMMIMVIIN